MTTSERAAQEPRAGDPKVLLVGAGAVGVAYGWHLRQGGAEVSFLVRARRAQELRGGITVYPARGLRAPREPARFEGFGVLPDLEGLAGKALDQVWLCMSSTGLRGPGPGGADWLAKLAAATGDATLVLLQPGLEDRAYVLARVPEARVVQGMIPFSSWWAPMPGDGLSEPGIAWWTPPFAKTGLAGDPARVAAVVRALQRGGHAAAADPHVARTAGYGAAVLMPFIATLECAGWAFARWRRGDHAELATRASREIRAVVAAAHGARPPRALALLGPTLLRFVTRALPVVAPIDLERFFAVHFTKVGDQTRLALATYREGAAARGLPHEAIAELARRLERLPLPAKTPPA